MNGHLRVLQLYPSHPKMHLQVPGAVQVPPFRHPCEQIATTKI